MARRFLFSDESGDLTFTKGPNISRYFAVGTLVIDEPELRKLRATLAALRDELAFRNHGLDSYFHATDDPYDVRQAVFGVLSSLDFQFDVTLLEKSKAQPHVRQDDATFFRYAWYYHLNWIAPRIFDPNDEALIVAAELGTKKTRKAFRGAIDAVLTQCISYRVKRSLAFWPCASDFALQAADYCTWAVTRKRERGDHTYFDMIQSKIRYEYDLWAAGKTHYY
ncbi:DUF3800 domain-containing protein [Micromonospora endophytica]|uniref:Uncharacterized protein n=1 Tax=Micromonospora endophytica TaxID=515350 RepID=A0A2W2BT45_9ACTN|nr:DUF3800 domain-containing protein [Micromonospora endophytica]PZF90425.1 hypothetical protein C1I93_22800 [Micromonospora endophytica]RIW46673.1 DUF3800 domain-containing protein [Micromonospora endophytica]BCJ59779.1 hypothetical protein Jiend_32010 [Micromonospora endophytica]